MADCETMLLSTSAPTSATTVTHTTATSAATPPTVTTESHGPNAVVWDAEADADADADIDVVDWNANPTSSKRPASFDSNDDLLTGPGKSVEEACKRSLDHFPSPSIAFPMPALDFDFRIAVKLKPEPSQIDGKVKKEITTISAGRWSGSFGTGAVVVSLLFQPTPSFSTPRSAHPYTSDPYRRSPVSAPGLT
jgi:hypothetical protein